MSKRPGVKSRIRETWKRIIFSPPDLPTHIQIEVTNRCNLNCQMCPRDVLGVLKEDMSFDVFKQIIDKIEGAKLVTLTGWGEPFLHPDLFPMIDYCKEKGLMVKLTTNGVLVDETVQTKIINSGLESLTFSLETIQGKNQEGHGGKVVAENLRGLLKQRKGKIPEVVVQTTIHQGKEKDLYEVIAFSAEMGVDRVNLARLDTRFSPSLRRPSAAEEEKIFNIADHLGREKGIQVDFVPYAVSQGVERLCYRLLRKSLHCFGKYCLRLYDYLYINLRGEVTPCCSLPFYSVGNILNEDLKTIWKGRKLQKFREKQKEICGACDQLQIRYNKSVSHD